MAPELRVALANGAQVGRMLALVQDGCPRREAAALNGMDRPTLDDWVHCYNDEGIDGLRKAMDGRLRAEIDIDALLKTTEESEPRRTWEEVTDGACGLPSE